MSSRRRSTAQSCSWPTTVSGAIFDLNVFATNAALDQLELDRPVTALTHQLAWTLGVGPLIEALGARPASHDSAREAFENGEHVLVFPGGDIEAGKPRDERNQVVFGGRSGFARLAIEYDVPIVPIVTAGAGESLLVLARGERLARALRVDKLLRIKALPLTVSLPWGVSVGAVGSCPTFRCPRNSTPACCPPSRPSRTRNPTPLPNASSRLCNTPWTR